MERTLRTAALGNLVALPNHPSIRVLRKLSYIERLEEVERRRGLGRLVVLRWGITESGRERLERLGAMK